MSTLPDSVTSCRSRTMYEMKGPNPMGGTRKYDNHPTGLQIRQMPRAPLILHCNFTTEACFFFLAIWRIYVLHICHQYTVPLHSKSKPNCVEGLQICHQYTEHHFTPKYNHTGSVTDLPPIYSTTPLCVEGATGYASKLLNTMQGPVPQWNSTMA